MPSKSLTTRLHILRRWLDQVFPYWKPTVAVIYGLVLIATIPILQAITTQFLRDVRNPAVEPDLMLRNCAIVALYIGYLGLDALITVLLVGTVAVVIMRITQEVVRIYRRIRYPGINTMRGPRPGGPRPPSNVTPITPDPNGGTNAPAA